MWQGITPGCGHAGPSARDGRCGDAAHGGWRTGGSEAGSLQQGRHRGRRRPGELLIDLASKNNYQLIVNMDKVEFLDSTGLGVLIGALKRVRAHDGSLDLVCTQERILKIFRITGLTKVFGIHQTVDQAIAAKNGE
jgi:anti-sigma B factor antagonist